MGMQQSIAGVNESEKG